MKKFLNRWLAYSMLLLAISGLAGCAKSVETPTPTDASITDAVKASLSTDSQLSGQRVDVTVSNGEVTLSGEVSTDAAHLQAYKLANETPGVKKVNDLLQVRPAAASAQPQEPASGCQFQIASRLRPSAKPSSSQSLSQPERQVRRQRHLLRSRLGSSSVHTCGTTSATSATGGYNPSGNLGPGSDD